MMELMRLWTSLLVCACFGMAGYDILEGDLVWAGIMIGVGLVSLLRFKKYLEDE